MPIVDQFKEIMQIHRQSQESVPSDFMFLVSYLRFCLDFIAILTKNVTLPSLARDHAVVFPIPAQHR